MTQCLRHFFFKEWVDFIVNSTFATHAIPTELSELIFYEHNASRYVVGFVSHFLSKRISNGIKVSVVSFSEGSEGEEEDPGKSTLQDFTKKWIRKTNRGQLFF